MIEISKAWMRLLVATTLTFRDYYRAKGDFGGLSRLKAQRFPLERILNT
jgi:hypothetical protein